MQQRINIQALPPLIDDIFLEILLYLTVKEACVSSLVNKKWRTKINAHTSFWKSKLSMHFPQKYYIPEATEIPIPPEQWKIKLAAKYRNENSKWKATRLQPLRSWREKPELVMPVLAQISDDMLAVLLVWLVKQGKQELLDRIYTMKSADLQKDKSIEFAIRCHQSISKFLELIKNYELDDLNDLLCIAAEVDHVDAINAILALRSELKLNWPTNKRNYYGFSFITIALRQGSVAFIKELIAHHSSQALSISLAISSGNLELIKLIYDLKHATFDDDRKTPLHHAADLQQEEVVEFLIARNADLNAVDANGNTPSFTAVTHGQIGILKQLKHAGANMQWRNSLGDTLLHTAARERGRIVVEWLITEKIIDITARNYEEKTALHVASERYYSDPLIIEYLIKSGCAVNDIDINHRQPIHMSVFTHNCQTIRTLVKYGADINAQDKDGNTPLHLAVLNFNTRGRRNTPIEIVEYLIKHGASSTQKNAQGQTPRDIALKEGHVTAVRRLFPANKDAEEKPHTNYIDLHNAAKVGKNISIKQLLANGADINATDPEGRTALHFAVMERKINAVKYMIAQGARKDIRDADGKLAKDYLSQYLGGYIPLLTPDPDNTLPAAVRSNKRGIDEEEIELEIQRYNPSMKTI